MVINKTIGGNRNRTDKATVISDITLNSTTSTVLVNSLGERIFFAVSNPSSLDVWLQFQRGDDDIFYNAIYLPKKSYWEMPLNLYDGIIKAKSVSGSPTVTVTEY